MPLLQAQLEIPILGVCLGLQALALAHGGHVTHAPEPVHGRLSAVQHSGHPLFKDIPSGARYCLCTTVLPLCCTGVLLSCCAAVLLAAIVCCILLWYL